MKKIILAIALCILCAGGFVACNKITNKSVFIPLTDQELEDIREVDTNFWDYVNDSIWTKAAKYETDSIKQVFGDVTYRDIHEYYQFRRDTAYWLPLLRKWENEHAQMFPNVDEKFDSVMNSYFSILSKGDMNAFQELPDNVRHYIEELPDWESVTCYDYYISIIQDYIYPDFISEYDYIAMKRQEDTCNWDKKIKHTYDYIIWLDSSSMK